MTFEEIEEQELKAITKILEAKGYTLEQLLTYSQEQAEKEGIGFGASDEVTEIRIKKPASAPVGKVVEGEAKNGIIKSGMKFNNYKKLCEFKGWKIATGKQKILQFEELGRICKYHKEGNKIIIDAVHQVAFKKVDERVNNKGNGKSSIYYNDFEILMLQLLEGSEGDSQEFTITQLMVLVGMVNGDYQKYKYKPKLLAKNTNASIEEINNFYEINQRLLSGGLRTCLNKMARAFLIHLTEITMIRTFDIVKPKIGGAETRKVYKDDRVATKEEIKTILGEKRRLMELMDCKNINEVYKKNLNIRFYRELKSILEEKYKISFDYTSYRVVLNKEAINKELEEIYIIAEKEGLILSINNKAYGKSKNNYEPKIIDRINKSVLDGFHNPNTNIPILTDRLIKLDSI